MFKLLIGAGVAAASAGVAYVVGRRRGGAAVHDLLVSDRQFALLVMEKLATRHGGVKLELFDTTPAAA